MSASIPHALRPVGRRHVLSSLQCRNKIPSQSRYTLLSSSGHDRPHSTIFSSPPLRTKCPHAFPRQLRSFSTCPQRHAAAAARAPRPNLKAASMPSMALTAKLQQAQAMARGDIPDDLGLLPMTVIMPTGSSRPSFVRNFQARWRLEKKRCKIRLTELVQNVYFHYWQVKPRPINERRILPSLAMEFYKEIYTALAHDNFTAMEDRLCQGFLSTLRARAAQRPQDLRLHWTLHRTLSAPKVVSYKAAVLPGVTDSTKEEQNGIVQAVVRLHTRQSLRHVRRIYTRDAKGRMVMREVQVDQHGKEIHEELPTEAKEPADAKDQVEYLVVQKSLRKGKFGEWMAWGLTTETPYDEIVKREEKLREMMSGARAGRAEALRQRAA